MKRTIAILITTLLLTAGAAAAKPGGGMELISRAEIEVTKTNEKGSTAATRVDASKANVPPGETVIFTTSYLNNGDQPATDVAIKNPVPENMVYIDNSAEGKGTRIEFSVDKGKSYGAISRLKIKSKAGRERPARADDITDVRWTFEKPLEPGSAGTVSFRAKVK